MPLLQSTYLTEETLNRLNAHVDKRSPKLGTHEAIEGVIVAGLDAFERGKPAAPAAKQATSKKKK
jgi:hypothetical protein